ncbi:hypothetical protein BDN70DRAFT_990297 [Pholiota conissans]|uniref:Uncharacterized protein n=1 Tax=Pholiota conissans TaxID=109636 RepID=A0A9P5Z9V8_9AGAR|nr:hypothetical protein BDN70DRAFT_990297 [Pholiota conissans]
MSTTSLTEKSNNKQGNGSSSNYSFVPLLESTTGMDIAQYMQIIEITAGSSPQRLSQLAHNHVVKLEHRKDKRNVQHEYIVATIQDHEERQICLVVSRCHSNENLEEKIKRVQRNFHQGSTMAASPERSQDLISKPTKAKDVIKNIGSETTFTRSRVLTTFIPDHDALPLLRFVEILYAVHKRSPEYALFRSQCYWFSMMVMGIAMSRGGSMTQPLDSDISYESNGPNTEKFSRIVHYRRQSPTTSRYIPASQPLRKMIGKKGWVPIVQVTFEEISVVATEAETAYLNKLKKVRYRL